jgi:hypothetical protein
MADLEGWTKTADDYLEYVQLQRCCVQSKLLISPIFPPKADYKYLTWLVELMPSPTHLHKSNKWMWIKWHPTFLRNG